MSSLFPLGRFSRAIVILCAVGLPLEKTYAWGIVGHKIVCHIAFEHLTPDLQAEVNQLVRSFKKPNGQRFKHFRESCAFADTARHNARDGYKKWQHYEKLDHWHYLNVPRDTLKLTNSTLNCRNDCVLHAISFHSGKLADSSITHAERGEALILLAHWVADIHQPLHVGFADDRGGSDVDVTPTKRFGRNLHSAWDSGLIKSARGKRKLRHYMVALGKIAEADKSVWAREQKPLEWAVESYLLATRKEAGYCQWSTVTNGSRSSQSCRAPSRPVRIDKAYQANNTPLLEQRLQQAAVRLATLLEALLRKAKKQSVTLNTHRK